MDVQDLPHKHKAKDNAIALKYREKGTEFYKKLRFHDALEFYNKSLCFAKNGSEALALAYGNRSAVYLQIKEFDLCLENIKLAREAKFPADKLDRLIERENRCNELKRQQKPSDDDDPWTFFKLSYEPKKNYPSIINSLELHTSQKYGRHVITRQDLRVGDIIAIEEPPFKKLDALGAYIRCCNCIKANKLSLLPLPNCAAAMVCSQECLDHGKGKYDCAVEDDNQIVPRITLEALEAVGGDLSKLKNLMKDTNLRKRTVFHLELSDSDHPSYRYNQLLAFNSFQENAEATRAGRQLLLSNSNDKRVFMGRFMMHVTNRVMLHTVAKIMNFMGKQEADCTGQLNDLGELIRFGRFFPLFGSLLNHSCIPNTNLLSVDNKLVYYVRHPIKRGEQIFMSYGPNYPEMPTHLRQKVCEEQFNFTCSCDACEGRWPEFFDSLPEFDSSYRFGDLEYRSIKTMKEEFKRWCAYIQENYEEEYPSKEINDVENKIQAMLQIIAGNETFLFGKMK